MAEINDLNVTDASNTARFPESMAPSAVNDGARALEGIIARWHNDINGSVSTTGSANAYVMAANQTLSAYYTGLRLCFEANHTNTGAATLNVDGVGAKAIKDLEGGALPAGAIQSGGRYDVIYETTADVFYLLGARGTGTFATDSAAATVVNMVNTSTASDTNAIRLDYTLMNDAGTPEEITYGRIATTSVDSTDGTEDGRISMQVMVAGTLTNLLQCDGSLGGSHTSTKAFSSRATVDDPTSTGDEGFTFNHGTLSYFANDGGAPLGLHRSDSGTSAENTLAWLRNGSTIAHVTVSSTTVAYNTSSDERLKENFRDVENAVDKVRALEPCRFTWKKTGEDQIGIIAQKAEKIVPWAVSERDDGYKQMDYSQIVGLLAAAIVELAAEVERLKR